MESTLFLSQLFCEKKEEDILKIHLSIEIEETKMALNKKEWVVEDTKEDSLSELSFFCFGFSGTSIQLRKQTSWIVVVIIVDKNTITIQDRKGAKKYSTQNIVKGNYNFEADLVWRTTFPFISSVA